MSADPLIPLRIASVGGRLRAGWSQGLRVRFPASLLDRTGWRGAVRPNSDIEIPDEAASITSDDVVALRERCAFTEQPHLSARLPVSYRVVPGWARAIVASAVGRRNRGRIDRWAAFPGWPLDLSTDVLDDLRQPRTPAVAAGRAPVVLTHDIDSPEGLTNLVSSFLAIEEAAGARSTSYIVPCAWSLDHELIAELVARGHEVGVHGYDHSNTTAFAAPSVRAERLDGTRRFAERYDAAGYRAPSLLRTRALLRDLGGRFRYDSSIPTSGGLFPVPNNGCATARPFLVEDIAELPVTMPRDGTLRFLGHTPDEILRLWIECADLIWRSRGVVVLLTHCERRFSGGDAMLGAYRQFVEHLRSQPDRFTFSNPRRVLESASLQPASRQPGTSTRAAAP